jgi:hypothetical protein
MVAIFRRSSPGARPAGVTEVRQSTGIMTPVAAQIAE